MDHEKLDEREKMCRVQAEETGKGGEEPSREEFSPEYRDDPGFGLDDLDIPEETRQRLKKLAEELSLSGQGHNAVRAILLCGLYGCGEGYRQKTLYRKKLSCGH